MHFTDSDRLTLESFKTATKGIANLFGPACEVLVHSLENYESTVISIENGHNSGRTVGAPMTDLALELINKTDTKRKFLEPYQAKFPNGNRCRSVTMPIKNGDKLIGLLCINLNLDLSFSDFITAFTFKKNEEDEEYTENFSRSIDDMMNSLMQKNINNIMLDTSIPNQEKNKVIILTLNKLGFFNFKGSIEALAEKLQISIHTVYSNLRKYTDKTED